MANREQLKLLKAGVEGWNKWRKKNPVVEIDLYRANLSGTNLSGVNLNKANLIEADLNGSDLSGAILSKADLIETNLSNASLISTNLSNANLNRANITSANLRQANCRKANLSGANLRVVNLVEADLSGADLSEANLNQANLSGANLSEANLSRADLSIANLRQADCRGANLSGANLSGTNLRGIDLSKADLYGADLWRADCRGANLSGAFLITANLNGTNLANADLSKASLISTNLSNANLSEANLSGADLSRANLVLTNISNAIISRSNIYGINVWDLEGEFKEQKELIITPYGKSAITVDNIEIAQFLYLILNNKKIRDVINTLTSKTVLILGRFSIPERKKILDTLRDKLREYDLLPVVFDFDCPTDKDFTETIKTLASISYFVIADVTNPKSSPLELQASVPDYQIPFVPIIQEGELPFAMMVDLQKKYNWVLDTISYDSLDTLIDILKPHIIDPAIKMRDKLRIIKAKEPTIISGRELKEKRGKP